MWDSCLCPIGTFAYHFFLHTIWINHRFKAQKQIQEGKNKGGENF